jgi:hypothetical protein
MLIGLESALTSFNLGHVVILNHSQLWLILLRHLIHDSIILHRIYSNLDSVEDSEVGDKILASLEKRWAAADQEPFIAAVVLNPYLRGDFFGRDMR